MNRLLLYSILSTCAAVGVVSHAAYTRKQFYPAVIYLVTSKFCIMVMCNFALMLTILFGQLIKKIFLGSLRAAEVETLYDNSRYAITETCLALTIFREEINLTVVTLFTALLFAKIFHWLCQSRVEYIEQSEIINRTTHVRILSLMAFLSALDVAFVAYCVSQIIETGPTVLVLFGFEFTILYISLQTIFVRYLLHMIDMSTGGNWTAKSSYVFYFELASEVVKVFLYLIFFMIIFTYYGMPLHILRDLWMSIKNLQRRIEAYMRYRRLTANMNERFPAPSEEQLSETDKICIICREEMTVETGRLLPCAHVFHLDCLRMWLQRQQTCPTCRSDIPLHAPRTTTTAPVAEAPQVNHNDPRQFPAVAAGLQNRMPGPAAPTGPTQSSPAVPSSVPPSNSPNIMNPMMMPGMMMGMSPFGMGSDPASAQYMQQHLEMMKQQLATQMAMMRASADPMVQHQLAVMQAQMNMQQQFSIASSGSTTPPPPSSGPSPVDHRSSVTSTNIPASSPVVVPPTGPSREEAVEEKASARVVQEEEEVVAESVEMPIPSAPMTRREELRQRYNRIYGDAKPKTDENNTE